MIEIKGYTNADVFAMAKIWNEVVKAGDAFPQKDTLTYTGAADMFAEQTYCGVAWLDGEIVGMYILHPNNVGRCGHISNASYAVRSDMRGKHVGEALVRDCMARAASKGFRILQFNAVVATNTAALNLYEKLGFTQLGVIKEGFEMPDGSYADIIPHYISLV